MARALGRLPHSPEDLAAAPSLATHRYAAMEPPKRLNRSGINYQPQLRHNDTLPDCAIVGLINGALAAEAIATNGPLAIADDCELAMYAGVAGCAPTEAAIAQTDGLILLDVLRKQARDGFDIGAVVPLTGSFGTIPMDRISLASVMAQLGFAYLGLNLYTADLAQPEDQTLDVATPPGALEGGHCLIAWSYSGLGNSDLVTLASWGTLITCTWAWLEDRLRESYAILFPTTASAGIDVVALAAENQRWLAA